MSKQRKLPELPGDKFYHGVRLRRVPGNDNAVLLERGGTVLRVALNTRGHWDVTLVRRWDANCSTLLSGVDLAVAVLNNLDRNPADALATKANDLRMEPPAVSVKGGDDAE